MTRDRWLGIAAPVSLALVFFLVWEGAVRGYTIPAYILPGPVLILETLWSDGPDLLGSLWVTFETTLAALAAATAIGFALAVLLSQSRFVERSVYPDLVTLQVTPVLSIAPLIIIWVKDDVFLALLICAWIVAFFPIVANTTFGLKSADRDLSDLFRLYGATRAQRLAHLQIPTALPYFLAGVRISGGLALIGTVVAEFVAGSGGSNLGLGTRILELGFRLQIAKLFVALLLLSLTGILIHALLGLLARYLLRDWHEGAGV